MSLLPAYLEDIQTANLWHTLRPVLVDYLQHFVDYPEVEGVVILGGAAATRERRFLDRFSDLDASIFISLDLPPDARDLSIREFLDHYQTLLPTWLPPFEVHIPCARHPEREVEINIHQQIIELEKDPFNLWSEPRREAYAETSEILFDRSGRVGELIREKIAWDDDRARRKLLEVLGQARWSGVVNPPRQIERGFPHNGHDLLNEALDLIVHAVYLVNRKYRPHRKWRLQRAFHLPLAPANFRSRLLEAMLIPEMTAQGIRSRVELVHALLDDVTALAREHYDLPQDCYAASCFESFSDRQLKKEVPADPGISPDSSDSVDHRL